MPVSLFQRLSLWSLLSACVLACGCAYGPPTPSAIARPEIPAGATPVYEWSVERVTVAYYWNKVNKYDIRIDAKGYFPASYKDAGDAIWQVELHTIATPDLPSVPGTYLGIQRGYVDATGVTQYEIVPSVYVPELKDGIYAVIDNGVEFTGDEAKTIKTIQPVLHLRMVRNQAIDPYFDLPIHLSPKVPTELTPTPKVGGPEDGPRGTPLTVPTAAPDGKGPVSQPIPGVTGAGGVAN